MALEEIKQNVEDIQENAKAYIESNIAYYKLWGFKVAMKSTTLALKFFLIAICLVVVLLDYIKNKITMLLIMAQLPN